MLNDSDLDCIVGDLDAPVRQGGRSVREILSGRESRDRAFGIRYKISKATAEKVGVVSTGDPRQDVVVRSSLAGGYLAAIDPSSTGSVSYSRNWDRYDSATHPLMRHRIVVPAVDHMIATGIADGVKARPGDHVKTGLQSTYRLKARVVEALHGEGLEIDPQFVSCRLRDENKRAIAWPLTEKARAISVEMDEIINPYLRSLTVSMPDDIEQISPGIYRCPLHITKPLPKLQVRKGRPMPTDAERQASRPKHNIFVAIDLAAHRVFNRGDVDLEMGGRLFGPWQSLWSEVRKRIMLNGRTCAEVDYTSLHARMTYGLAGQRCPKDPYTVADTRFSRKQGKVAFLIMLNARDRKEAIAAIAWSFGFEIKVASRLYHEVIRKNWMIRTSFASDLGIRLMNADADICIRVLRECIDRSIPCLPVHDSFIVPEDAVDAVNEIKDRILADWLRTCRAPKAASVSNGMAVGEEVVLHMVDPGIPPVSPSPAILSFLPNGLVPAKPLLRIARTAKDWSDNGGDYVPEDPTPHEKRYFKTHGEYPDPSWVAPGGYWALRKCPRYMQNLIDCVGEDEAYEIYEDRRKIYEDSRRAKWDAAMSGSVDPKPRKTSGKRRRLPVRRNPAVVQPAPVQPIVDGLQASILSAFPGSSFGRVVTLAA